MNILQLDWIAIRSYEMQPFTSSVSFFNSSFSGVCHSAKFNLAKSHGSPKRSSQLKIQDFVS